MKCSYLLISKSRGAIACAALLSAFCLSTNLPSPADETAAKDAKDAKDAKANDAATKPAAADSAATTPGRKHHKANAAPGGGGGHHHHDRTPAKRQVMSLSTLTDKQKQQLNTIYGENAEQFKSLTKQLSDLRAAEWQKIEPVLTKDQLSQLGIQPSSESSGSSAKAQDSSSASNSNSTK